jgi:hypothetical protein
MAHGTRSAYSLVRDGPALLRFSFRAMLQIATFTSLTRGNGRSVAAVHGRLGERASVPDDLSRLVATLIRLRADSMSNRLLYFNARPSVRSAADCRQ